MSLVSRMLLVSVCVSLEATRDCSGLLMQDPL